MAWIKLDVNFLENPKVDSVSDSAKLLHLWGLCYAGRQLSDGLIPTKQVSTVEKIPLVAELVTALLWHPVTNGFQIHDYLLHQSSKEKVKTSQESTRKRVEKHREKTNVTPLRPMLLTPLEIEIEVEIEVNTKEGKKLKIDLAFEEFWKVYPRHNGGVINNRKSFAKALKVASAEQIIAGALKYALDPNRQLEFTAYPATWLNQGRWDDPPLPPQSLHTGVRRLDKTPTVLPPKFDPAEFAKKPLKPEMVAKLRRENGI